MTPAMQKMLGRLLLVAGAGLAAYNWVKEDVATPLRFLPLGLLVLGIIVMLTANRRAA